MIEVSYNGENLKLEKNYSIAELLLKQGVANKKVAVAVNGEFVPRSAYAEQKINVADKIDVLSAVQGG